MASISGLSVGMTLQFFQSAASMGMGVGVSVRAGTVEAGRTAWVEVATVGWRRVGTAVVGIALGVVAGPAEQAASKAIISPRKKNLSLIFLFTCGLNSFRDLAGQHGFAFWREMNAA